MSDPRKFEEGDAISYGDVEGIVIELFGREDREGVTDYSILLEGDKHERIVPPEDIRLNLKGSAPEYRIRSLRGSIEIALSNLRQSWGFYFNGEGGLQYKGDSDWFQSMLNDIVLDLEIALRADEDEEEESEGS